MLRFGMALDSLQLFQDFQTSGHPGVSQQPNTNWHLTHQQSQNDAGLSAGRSISRSKRLYVNLLLLLCLLMKMLHPQPVELGETTLDMFLSMECHLHVLLCCIAWTFMWLTYTLMKHRPKLNLHVADLQIHEKQIQTIGKNLRTNTTHRSSSDKYNQVL